ncbi:MAG: AAA family ATPase [Caldilineae bacterium]|nr:AAA family ATPase [Chloroflexota bacterium]MCB9177440.1 AAA family ATPase [Caldilineae bacterium]
MSATESRNRTEPEPLELGLLGPLRLRRGGVALPPPRTAKGRALLALLAGAERALPREHLMALLWESAPPEKASGSLRVALSDLRRALGDRLEADRSHLRLRTRAGDRIDLRLLVDWEAGRLEDPAALAQALAVEGELLEGLEFAGAPELDAWLTAERRRWAELRARAALDQAEVMQADGDLAGAERLLRRGLRLAPEREDARRRLMRLLARQGRFDEALAQHEAGRRALETELGLLPEPATTALRERILAARSRPPASAPPATSTAFVGRESELIRLDAWLRQPDKRLLSLLGPGGVGKTRLAIELAERNRDRFLDGVCYVELDRLEPGAPIEPELARALRVGSSSAEPRQQVLQAIGERELLLVLDNYEHLMGQVELCASLLAGAPRLRILVTSREALGLPGEQRLRLSGLSLPEAAGQAADAERHDAAALFVAAARRIRPDFDPRTESPALGELCRQLEGLPLALELAAAWLEVADCRGIVETIALDARRLEAVGSGFPARHSSIEAVFEGSWRLLMPAERLALARLGVFRGGFDGPAAQSVAGLDLGLLRSLARKSLIDRQPEGRYRMHALLRQLAEARLAEQPALEQAVRDRHAEHYLALWSDQGARLFGSDARIAAERLAPELDNALSAWRRALSTGRFELLEASLEAWLRFFRLRGPYAQALVLFEAAAKALAQDATADVGRGPRDRLPLARRRLLGRLQGYRAYLLSRSGQGDRAARLAAESLALAGPIADAPALAFGHWVVGILALNEGRLEAAEQAFRIGLEAGRQAAHVELQAENRWQLAVLAYYRDDLDGFESAAGALLERCQALDLRHLEGRLRESLASVLSRRGNQSGARAHLAAAHTISEAMDDRLGAINVLGSLAELALHAGELDRATALVTDALVQSLDIGAEESAVVMRWGLATIQLAGGQIASAEAGLQTCHAAAVAGGYRYWEACTATSMAQAARMRGDGPAAEAHLARARPLWDAIGHAWGKAFAWLELGWLALAAAELDRAADALARAARHAREAKDPIRGLQVQLALGRLDLARGQAVDARRRLEAAGDDAVRLGAGLLVVACREALVDCARASE